MDWIYVWRYKYWKGYVSERKIPWIFLLDRKTDIHAEQPPWAHIIVWGRCTDARERPCTDTQTRVITSKNSRGSTCTDDLESACTDVSTESTGVHGITCPYIPTKGTGRHGVMSTHNSTVKTVLRGRMNAYKKYVRYETILYIGTEILGKVNNGISYADALDQGY